MKSIIKPIEFISPLSEVEVRMTLRELCGSSLYHYPFRGMVDKSSFCFKPNYSVKNTMSTTLVGNFAEQNGKTHVSISLKTSAMDCIVGIFVVFIAILGFMCMLAESFIAAVAFAIPLMGFSVGLFALHYGLLWSRFHRSVAKIKKALGV